MANLEGAGRGRASGLVDRPGPLMLGDGVRAWARIAGSGTRDDGRALEPRPLWLIEAEGHRFGGKEQDLNQRLMDAIAWIGPQR